MAKPSSSNSWRKETCFFCHIQGKRWHTRLSTRTVFSMKRSLSLAFISKCYPVSFRQNKDHCCSRDLSISKSVSVPPTKLRLMLSPLVNKPLIHQHLTWLGTEDHRKDEPLESDTGWPWSKLCPAYIIHTVLCGQPTTLGLSDDVCASGHYDFITAPFSKS